MAEDMKVRVELWPVVADPPGGAGPHELWLLSGEGPWLSPNIAADDEPHSEVARLVSGVAAAPVLVHSTSWRPFGPAVRLTYVAVFKLRHGQLALDVTEDPRPITRDVFELVGPPWHHEVTEPPTPRDIDVLSHGLGHLTWLREHNAKARIALAKSDMGWYLDHLAPTLAGLYQAAA